MKSNMNTVLISIALSTAATAHAGVVFSESENNNSLNLADDLGSVGFGSSMISIGGFLNDSDVDWFRFTLTGTATSAIFSSIGPNGADGVMQLVAQGGDVIAFDDDSSIGFMPSISASNLAAGTYYIGLTGWGDVDASSVFTDELANGNGHTEFFDYNIDAEFIVIPSPGALALFGIGGAMMTKRRRSS